MEERRISKHSSGINMPEAQEYTPRPGTDSSSDDQLTTPVRVSTKQRSPRRTDAESANVGIDSRYASIRAFSLREMFGWIALTILSLGTVFLLGALGFLWFLWTANDNNPTWHSIATNNWMTRAVSLSALTIRNSLSIPAGTATSMLAALLLENIQTLMIDFAAVSGMRNSNGGPYVLLWFVLRSFYRDQRRWRRIFLPILVLLLAITTFLAQFTSTTLLSDLELGVVTGRERTSAVATNYDYNNVPPLQELPGIAQNTIWRTKLSTFPPFAEYRENGAQSPATGADTGLTLRALLPLKSEQARTRVQSFSGHATVGDFTVKCQRPRIRNEHAHFQTSGLIGLTGSIIDTQDKPLGFQALVSLQNFGDAAENQPWSFSFASLGAFSQSDIDFQRPSVLETGLYNYENKLELGKMYLALNITKGTVTDWEYIIGADSGAYGTFGNAGKPPNARTANGEWLDLVFSADISVVMSVSICYAFSEVAVLPITAVGKQKRTEPTLSYSSRIQSFTFHDIRHQLGQSKSHGEVDSLDDRGLLSLERKGSWATPKGQNWRPNWIQLLLDMTYTPLATTTTEFAPGDLNYTALFSDQRIVYSGWPNVRRLSVDPSLSGLAQEILRSGGSIAFALQSILTVLTTTAFYDQIQAFDGFSIVRTTYFETVTVPVLKRGLAAVTAVSLFHLLIVLSIVLLFTRKTRVSTIANAWQTVTQSYQCAPSVIVENSALKTDDEVRKTAREPNWKRTFLGVELSSENDEEVVAVQQLHTRNLEGLAKRKGERSGGDASKG